MEKTEKKLSLGALVDIAMFAVLLLQMMYVFTGNTLHEVLGIAFFVCLVIHLVIKRRQLRSLFSFAGKSKARAVSNASALLLLLLSALLMVSSMDVSRLIFPWFRLIGSSDLHKYLATSVLTVSALHGGMYFYIRSKRKKRAAVVIALCCAAAAAFGLALVPYLNRHFRKVEIDRAALISGERLELDGRTPQVVYFTRVGNTDFEPDVDAVSGASLMLSGGELVGNTQLMAGMVCDMLGCGSSAITLTGEKYPSSYGDTVAAAGRELSAKARPAVEPIDLSGCDTVVLIYPLWWGTIPMPVATFLESTDLSGKTLYLVATQGSSGFGSSADDIRSLAKGAEVIEVTSVYCDDIPDARETLRVKLAEAFAE